MDPRYAPVSKHDLITATVTFFGQVLHTWKINLSACLLAYCCRSVFGEVFCSVCSREDEREDLTSTPFHCLQHVSRDKTSLNLLPYYGDFLIYYCDDV